LAFTPHAHLGADFPGLAVQSSHLLVKVRDNFLAWLILSSIPYVVFARQCCPLKLIITQKAGKEGPFFVPAITKVSRGEPTSHYLVRGLLK
jgi:hypothetical protein